jgi:hypothetical protein
MINFKNILLILIIQLSVISCLAQKHKKDKSVPLDIRKETKHLIDSLRSEGVDTILSFYKGCSGCVEGIYKSEYLFWKKNNQIKIKKVDSYIVYKEVLNAKDIFSYYFDNYNNMQNDSLTEPPSSLIDGPYTEINLYYDNKIYQKNIPNYYRTKDNLDKKLMIWMYYIESILFNIERTSMHWIR